MSDESNEPPKGMRFPFVLGERSAPAPIHPEIRAAITRLAETFPAAFQRPSFAHSGERAFDAITRLTQPSYATCGSWTIRNPLQDAFDACAAIAGLAGQSNSLLNAATLNGTVKPWTEAFSPILERLNPDLAAMGIALPADSISSRVAALDPVAACASLAVRMNTVPLFSADFTKKAKEIQRRGLEGDTAATLGFHGQLEAMDRGLKARHEREIESLELARRQAAAQARAADVLTAFAERLEKADHEREEMRAELARLRSDLRTLGKPGRPTPWPLVEEEFRCRVARRQLGESRSDMARTLAEWLERHHPGQTMSWRSIANRIARDYRTALVTQQSDAARRARKPGRTGVKTARKH